MAKVYTREDKINFINTIYGKAREVAGKSGFSLEFILAQAAYETGWGEKILPGTNNLFNIKAGPSWTGAVKTFIVPEKIKIGDETKTIYVESKFRAYESFTDSINDWLDFLRNNPRYHGIGANSDGTPHINIFDPEVKKDPKLLAVGFWHDGYATEPDYVNQVVRVMRGPTMKTALQKAKTSNGLKKTGSRGGAHSGETLKRDASEYHIVWRIEPDGSTRGYFICND